MDWNSQPLDRCVRVSVAGVLSAAAPWPGRAAPLSQVGCLAQRPAVLPIMPSRHDSGPQYRPPQKVPLLHLYHQAETGCEPLPVQAAASGHDRKRRARTTGTARHPGPWHDCLNKPNLSSAIAGRTDCRESYPRQGIDGREESNRCLARHVASGKNGDATAISRLADLQEQVLSGDAAPRKY